MKTNTRLKAGTLPMNHNATLVRPLKIKTSLKSGAGTLPNHNQSMARLLETKTIVGGGRASTRTKQHQTDPDGSFAGK